jgi:hypothetical protein
MVEKDKDIRVPITIFYTVTQPEKPFDIYNMPPNWTWVGAGHVEPFYNTKSNNIVGASSKYKREEQFKGPEETREKAKQILDKQLRTYMEAGILQFYHIQNTYHPIPT